MGVFLTIIIIAVVLLTIIFFHELGHFIACRAAGVTVLEFGIGIPPRLFAFKRGDTEYSLNLIPLGAFVKPVGEQDPTIQGSLASRSPWVRMGVSAAGPLANGLLAFVLFSISLMIPMEVVVGNGVMVNQVSTGSPAEEADVLAGDIIMSVDGKDIHSSTDLRDAINSSEEGSEITLLLNRDGDEISRSLVPEYDPEEHRLMMGVLIGQLGVMVDQVDEGSPAEEAGIQPGDVVLTVDGKRIYNSEDLSEAINSGEQGEELTLLLQRGSELISKDLVPEFAPETGQLSIGVDGRWVETYTEKQRYPFLQAMATGGEYIIHMPSMIVDSFNTMGGDFSDAVVGPVGVVQIAGETTKYGASAIIGLAGLISVGIGLFNLFPIPPLDGGGILVAAVEGARRGKRLSPRAMQLTYAIGAAFLITIFFVVTYNDILRLIRGDSVLP